MQFGSWNFRPGLWPTIATILMFPLLISLGFWQLDRASQKAQIMQTFEKNYHSEPLTLTPDLAQDQQAIEWRKVRLDGHFDPEQQFLFDNQLLNSRLGYYVFTPFKLNNEPVYVLINRGWIAAHPDRHVLPDVTVTTKHLTLTGTAKQPPGNLVLSQDLEELTERLPGGLIRLQQVKMKQIQALTDHSFLPFVVRLDKDSPAGYERDWVLPGSGKEKHYGYAFQWFAMAAALLIIYVVVNTRKTKGA